MSFAVGVTVEFLDGTNEIHTWVTRQAITDGCLHLFTKSGEMCAEEHVASYPLTSIKKWTRKER